MGRTTNRSPEQHPWTRPDMLPHAIASAGWNGRYPALSYNEFSAEWFVPHATIRQILVQERFAVVVRQGTMISFIDLSHIPERTFSDEDSGRSDVDWANIRHYNLTDAGPVFNVISLREGIDPRDIMPAIHTILATPLGVLPLGQSDILKEDVPIDELLIEFPAHREERELRLDTTIGVLGGVATQQYLETIYGARV